MILIRIVLCGILLLSLNRAIAQTENSQSLVSNISAAYEAFDYDETDRLLKIALDQIDNFSASDQIQIYKFAAFREFQKGDSFQAKEYFWNTLEMDPTFGLDPITTSPKILNLFQKTKVEYLENLQQHLKQLEQNTAAHHPVPWRSLLYPGWEQIHRGYSLKGALFAAGGTACLIGFARAVIRTNQKQKDYENATTPGKITAYYNDYNKLYKSQFYWSYAYIAIWLSSHIDALFFSPAKSPRTMAVSITPTHPGLSFTYHF